MERLTENKIILVVKKTRLDELIARFNTEAQARFYVEHLGADFSDYQLEDKVYKSQVSQLQSIISRFARLQIVDREYIPNFIFGADDLLVVFGPDGLVANVLKYLNGQKVIGVNPDPKRWEGVLLPFLVSDLAVILTEQFNNARPIREVTMAKAVLNTGESLYAVNDLFIGPKSHTSARYSIEIGGKSENHSSSGIIVSTGLGSTGWFRSILAGARGIVTSVSDNQVEDFNANGYPWDANYLHFSVREPWPSRNSSANITFGRITTTEALTLVSQMPENGVIFSDGIEKDFIQFNSGTRAQIGVADKRGYLVG